ncbi:DUF862-domain-containing protein [Ramaria rubella]|nr:DUF862-domain-containing protein [Ramaria rubella]
MSSVQLYVYDLSNGLARQLSLQMTGKQIDGIWHTSVVVFGQEIFYGQGISITSPGKSHHGTPIHVIDIGETAIDQETFEQYLSEIREHYTADKYHLLDFNCNSFTNDCVGFLTGGSIPSWIKDLPQDFLSTPFGAALRPTIDNMYRRPHIAMSSPSPGTSNGDLSSPLLQAVAAEAVSGSSSYPTPAPTPPGTATSTLTSPLRIVTNTASLTALISSHRCATVFFTSQTCAPCRIVEPVFESLAHSNASENVVFAIVDIVTGLGGQIANEWNVRATPTFLFFLDGKKVHELKGADAGELRTQVNLLVFQAFPPHPHTSMSLPAVRTISLQPILFSQVPAWDAAIKKLESFIDSNTGVSKFDQSNTKNSLSEKIIPFLRARFSAQDQPKPDTACVPAELLSQWSSATITLIKALPPSEIFPLVDFWRLGLLDSSVSSWAAAVETEGATIVELITNKAIGVMDITSPNPRNLILTSLRFLANGFSNPILARHLLDPMSRTSLSRMSRENITALLVPALLHADAHVRTAAASLAFNIAAHYQRPLVEAQRSGRRGEPVADNTSVGQGDWEVEIVSAIVEALSRETENEGVVHRLVASLALFLHLSPYWEQLSSFVEVLRVKDMLSSKLQPGNGEKGLHNKDVRKLIQETMVLCSQ